MSVMKSSLSEFVPRWMTFAVVLSFCLPAFASEGPTLPDGVAVQVEKGFGANAVWIEIGGDLLAVDGGALEKRSPRYFLSTGAPGSGETTAVVLRPAGRGPVSGDEIHPPVLFDSGFTLSAGGREAVFFDLGRCATAGDAVVWLPKPKVLVTGRLVSRGRVEASSASDLSAWATALQRLQSLEPEIVIPGRGAVGGADLLAGQLARLTGIVAHVEDELLAGRSASEISNGMSASWFIDWRRNEPETAGASLEAVIDRVAGLQPPWELMEERGLREGPSPTRDDEGWKRSTKVLWRNYWPDRLPLLEQVAPGVEIVPFDDSSEALGEVADADAIIGTATRELLAAGERLRWVQVGSAGVERYLAIPQLESGEVVLTNGQRLASPEIGEHVMALTRALARGLGYAVAAQADGEWIRSKIGSMAPLSRLRGKTMFVVGLGGIGTEVARLASAAGMRVIATRSSRRSGPSFVDRVGLSEDLLEFASEADVVANCLPLTPETEDVFDAEVFAAMRPSAFFINVGRGGTVDTDALIAALENGQIAGAGLDVTDPEPLPADHPLWKVQGVIITPHYAAWSDVGRERRWLLYRENLRRFVAGERLLSVVDPARGY
jgi:phosphoglycerate dehydrogenase-like enzyme/glyoxylase-like metal-dependent hydrolase (beta-lactamase superfamily II)